MAGDIKGNLPKVPFDLHTLQKMWDECGVNCGPTALSAITGHSLDRVVEAIPGFRDRRYTTERMMHSALRSLNIPHTVHRDLFGGIVPRGSSWPRHGLVRVVWDGPWARQGDVIDRLRHSHWIGVTHIPEAPGQATPSSPGHTVSGRNTPGSPPVGRKPSSPEDVRWIFDFNAMSAGGWIPFSEWHRFLRPWLLSRSEPEAYGGWMISDSIGVHVEGPAGTNWVYGP